MPIPGRTVSSPITSHIRSPGVVVTKRTRLSRLDAQTVVTKGLGINLSTEADRRPSCSPHSRVAQSSSRWQATFAACSTRGLTRRSTGAATRPGDHPRGRPERAIWGTAEPPAFGRGGHRRQAAPSGRLYTDRPRRRSVESTATATSNTMAVAMSVPAVLMLSNANPLVRVAMTRPPRSGWIGLP